MEIEKIVNLIDGQMQEGVNRLSVGFSDKMKEGSVQQRREYGKKDAWNPWPWGEDRSFGEQDPM